jgi:lipoprotein-anchoring transpeptidase ErfK/SrfK
MLHRKSNKEFLYKGKAGDIHNSQLVRVFQVKTGVDGKSPTPLPKLLGREYWLITDKVSSEDNPDTAPYFLTLDIPSGGEWPYGPVPYNECDGQCDWVLPGYFGLHGTASDSSKLSKENPGSSGCIRHSDSDITYLYNILTPEKEEIRYYIEDI